MSAEQRPGAEQPAPSSTPGVDLVDVIDVTDDAEDVSPADAESITVSPSEPAPADEEPGPGVYGFPTRMRPLTEGLLVCAVVGVVLVFVQKLWGFHPNVPSSYIGDGVFGDMMTKSIRDNGWLLHNPRIGAPFAGNLYDYPSGGENVHFAIIKFLGFFLPSYAAMQNGYFLLTYFLDALAAYFVARYLKLGRGASLVVGVLYAYIPYHQAHGEAQITRSGYYIVPLAALVILWLIDYRARFFETGAARPPLATRRWRWAFVIGVCVVLGASDTQNSIFAACMLGTAAVVLAMMNRDLRPIALGAIAVAAIGASLVVNNAPFILYRRAHGPNAIAASRSLIDVDTYSLSLSRMLLPTWSHRIPGFAHLENTARLGSLVNGELGEALGAIAALGLVVGLVVAFGRIFRNDEQRPRRPVAWSRSAPMVGRLGGLSLVAFIFATTGGVSYLLALGGLKMLRTWNRIVVYIAFFALLIVGVLLDMALRRLRVRRRGAALVAGVVALVLIVGVLDQTSPKNAPDYKAIAKKYEYDDYFFKTLEARLPTSAMVFEYPIVRFPESRPVGKMQDYEQFIGYLHTKDLRWSYGGMKGRLDGDWQVYFGTLPVRTQLAGLAAIGFEGVYVNRDGYAGSGSDFEQQVRAVLGAPILRSTDNRLFYYDLAPMRRQIDAQLTAAERRGLRDALLNPITVDYGTGFYGEESAPGSTWHWAQAGSQLVIHNPSKKTERVELTATLSANPGTVEIAGLGATTTVPVVRSGSEWRQTLELPPGTTKLNLLARVPRTVSNEDPRVLFMSVTNLALRAPAIQDAMCRFEPAGATRPTGCP